MSEILGIENTSMWVKNECNNSLTLLEVKPFWTILEIFCDNFIHMAQTCDPAQFLHLSRALLHGIHSVFGQDPRRRQVGSEKIGTRLYG